MVKWLLQRRVLFIGVLFCAFLYFQHKIAFLFLIHPYKGGIHVKIQNEAAINLRNTHAQVDVHSPKASHELNHRVKSHEFKVAEIFDKDHSNMVDKFREWLPKFTEPTLEDVPDSRTFEGTKNFKDASHVIRRVPTSKVDTKTEESTDLFITVEPINPLTTEESKDFPKTIEPKTHSTIKVKDSLSRLNAEEGKSKQSIIDSQNKETLITDSSDSMKKGPASKLAIETNDSELTNKEAVDTNILTSAPVKNDNKETRKLLPSANQEPITTPAVDETPQGDDRSAVETRQGNDRSAVNTPQGDDRSAVETRQGNDRSAVKTPQGDDRSAVETPQEDDRSAVKTPQGDDRSAVETRQGGDRSAVKTPQGDDRFAVETPQGDDRSVVETPQRDDRSAVETPQGDDRSAIETPQAVDRSAVETPQAVDRSAVETPQAVDRSVVKNPQGDGQSDVETPHGVDRSAVEPPQGLITPEKRLSQTKAIPTSQTILPRHNAVKEVNTPKKTTQPEQEIDEEVQQTTQLDDSERMKYCPTSFTKWYKSQQIKYTKDNTDELNAFIRTQCVDRPLQSCQKEKMQGPLFVDRRPVDLKWLYEVKLSYVKRGGWYHPLKCPAQHHTAILVPFRNREQHLPVFLRHLHPVLKRQRLHYRIFVIEQVDGYTFNRAKLFNVGYNEALKHFPYDCFVFHDVDLIPENDRIEYSCRRSPSHLSVAVNTFNYQLPYKDIFGGVSSMRREHFERLNGFPNMFWSWGGEDDNMSKRLRDQGYVIHRQSVSLSRYTMLGHKEAPRAETNDRVDFLGKSYEHFDEDGLNSLRYDVIGREYETLYTRIKVNLRKDKDNSFGIENF